MMATKGDHRIIYSLLVRTHDSGGVFGVEKKGRGGGLLGRLLYSIRAPISTINMGQ